MRIYWLYNIIKWTVKSGVEQKNAERQRILDNVALAAATTQPTTTTTTTIHIFWQIIFQMWSTEIPHTDTRLSICVRVSVRDSHVLPVMLDYLQLNFRSLIWQQLQSADICLAHIVFTVIANFSCMFKERTSMMKHPSHHSCMQCSIGQVHRLCWVL